MAFLSIVVIASLAIIGILGWDTAMIMAVAFLLWKHILAFVIGLFALWVMWDDRPD